MLKQVILIWVPVSSALAKLLRRLNGNNSHEVPQKYCKESQRNSRSLKEDRERSTTQYYWQ